MPLVRLRGPLKRLAGDRAEHAIDGRLGRGAAARARARAPGDERLDPRRARRAAPPHQRVRQRRAGRLRDAGRAPTTGSTCCRRCRAAADDRAAARHEEGPVRARRRARRAVRGHRPRVRRRAGRVRGARPALRPHLRLGHVAVLRAEALVHRRAGGEWEQAEGLVLPAGGETALERIWVDRARRGRRLRVRRRRSRRAVREPRRRRDVRAQPRALGAAQPRRSWQPGAGGLCLHSIVPWPGEPDRLAIGDLGRRRVAHRRRRRELAARQRRASSPRYLPEDAPDDEDRAVRAPPARARRRDRSAIFMQFHGGVYRSDDAGASWTTSPTGLPSDFGFPLAVDPADADSAYVIPLVADVDRVTPDGRVRVYETRDAGASWTPRGDGLPVRERLPHRAARGDRTSAARAESLELYFGATSGDVFGSGDAGATLVRASRRTCRRSARSPPPEPLPAFSAGSGSSTRDRGAAARRRIDVDAAVERVDAVAQAVQAGAGRRVRAADAVVADLQREAARARATRSTQAPRAPARAWRRWSAPRR